MTKVFLTHTLDYLSEVLQPNTVCKIEHLDSDIIEKFKMGLLEQRLEKQENRLASRRTIMKMALCEWLLRSRVC